MKTNKIKSAFKPFFIMLAFVIGFLTLLILYPPKERLHVNQKDLEVYPLTGSIRDTAIINDLNQKARRLLEAYMDSLPQAKECAEQALFLSRQLNYGKGLAISNDILGIIFYRQGHYSSAETHFEKAVEQRDHIDDPQLMYDIYDRLIIAQLKTSAWRYLVMMALDIVLIGIVGYVFYLIGEFFTWVFTSTQIIQILKEGFGVIAKSLGLFFVRLFRLLF
ncbi:MAG: tetratricopeptide repeat protein [Bacteroidia bacterium]